MGGVLRRVGEHAWEGTLNGYAIHVRRLNSGWNLWVEHPRGFTILAPAVANLADGARRARAWVEAHPQRPGQPTPGAQPVNISRITAAPCRVQTYSTPGGRSASSATQSSSVATPGPSRSMPSGPIASPSASASAT